ncbi:MAG: marine proteobacterial sortase target protein [Gammaproteobacteria bacterium]|jgi:Ca-activated chloride channel family protein|nr:marine proteobacterial sortase target protein [Gammaproteobacteria bacterium]
MQRTESDFKSWLWVLALVLVLLSGPEAAKAEGPTPNEMQSGSLLLRMASGYSTATLLDTDVGMNISGLVARVSVRQEFRNTSAQWVEGIYVFPLPDRAAVDRMRLHIGERFIEGEIQEKEHARKTYEKAKQAGQKASLVEQQRANLFTTKVANIAPGELVVIEVEYLEDIRYEEGQFSIRFPMTLTPRYISGKPLPDRIGSGWAPDTDRIPDASAITPPQVTQSTAHQISLTAHVNAGMPLEIIASRYHPVRVAEENGQYEVSLRAGTVAMDHDFELVWRPVPSASPRAMSFVETVDGKPHYLLMMMPPDQGEVAATTIPRETIFIIDTSGSMHGTSLQHAQRAVQLALKGLGTSDLFNVIEFNSVTSALYTNSKSVSEHSVREASQFVRRLEANGGTEMRPALSMALDSTPSAEHLRQVIFITDGSVGYEDELFSMIEDRLGSARLFTVGIGSAPNSWFMQKAAELGRGSFTFISALHEVQEKMDGLFRKLQHPQVTDIKIEWPSGVVVDSFPSTVPDLYLGEPVAVKVAASGILRPGDFVRVGGNSVGGGWTADIPVSMATESAGVAALWARARIGELMNLERRSSDPEDLRSAIVETALAHHLVSKYTSLVAVDKTPARQSNDPLKSEQVPNLVPYGQSTNAIFGFPATATDAPTLRFIGCMSLLLALILFMLQWTAGGMCRVQRH